MKQILLDFWAFIKQPKDERYSGIDRNYKWKVFFSLFLFNILFSAIYTGIFSLVNYLHPLETKFDDLDLPPILLLLIFPFIIPFLEELVFRLGLRRKGIIAYLFTDATWEKWFSILIYISTISFALIHITNYKYDSYFFLLLAPILTLSQFVSGFIMTYLRVRFNFWIGFAFHALWNLSAVIFMFNDFSTSSKNILIENDTYRLEISKSSPFNFENKTLLYTADSDTIYQLESNNFSTKEILEMMEVSDDNYHLLIKNFDIQFNSKKGIPNDSLLSILEKEGYIQKQTPTN